MIIKKAVPLSRILKVVQTVIKIMNTEQNTEQKENNHLKIK
jgi:hypothetical protein